MKKKYLLLFVVISLSVSSFGQVKYRKLPEAPPPVGGYPKNILAIEKKNHDCVRINVKSFSQRLKKYPYNKVTRVQLVSFEGERLPMMNDTVCYSKLKEIKTLTLSQIDSLTDILYNVGFGGTILIIREMSCYSPRNAILFVNSDDKVFEYIELCFECEQFVVSSDKIEFGDTCNQKFTMLKKLFIRAGINYGVRPDEKE